MGVPQAWVAMERKLGNIWAVRGLLEQINLGLDKRYGKNSPVDDENGRPPIAIGVSILLTPAEHCNAMLWSTRPMASVVGSLGVGACSTGHQNSAAGGLSARCGEACRGWGKGFRQRYDRRLEREREACGLGR